MKQKYDFDAVIERRGTHAVKCDCLNEEFGCSDLLPLWVADMDFAVCPAITQALADRILSHPVYGYTKPIASYWQSIIDWQRERNGFELAAEELCFIPGIVSGFGLALNFYTAPGDKVVIQEPVYHPFRRLIEGNGRVTVNNPLIENELGYYDMDLADLERIFSEQKTVMMVLCNPHNPVGISWQADVLRRVAELACKYGVIVFSDEIHGDLLLGDNKHTPFASVSDAAASVALTFGAPSKTFNIAGIVSSWCAVKNPALRTPFFQWLETNELCSPNFVAMTATEAAYRHGGEWLDQCLEYIEGNADYVCRYCEEHIPGVRAVKPQASFLVWLDCRGLGLSHDEIIKLFVKNAGLALNEGGMFGEAGRGHMRLNVASPRSVIETAMARLEKAVKDLK